MKDVRLLLEKRPELREEWDEEFDKLLLLGEVLFDD